MLVESQKSKHKLVGLVSILAFVTLLIFGGCYYYYKINTSQIPSNKEYKFDISMLEKIYSSKSISGNDCTIAEACAGVIGCPFDTSWCPIGAYCAPCNGYNTKQTQLNKENKFDISYLEKLYSLQFGSDCTFYDSCEGINGCVIEQSWCPVGTMNCPTCA